MSLFDGLDVTSIDAELLAAIEKSHAAALAETKGAFKVKMDSLDAKLKHEQERAKAFEGIEPDEVDVLRKSRGKSSELEAALNDLKQKYQQKEKAVAEKEAALVEKEQFIKKLDFSRKLTDTVRQFNTQNPNVAVRDDMLDIVEMLAATRSKEVEGVTVFMKDDGTPLVKESGYAGVDTFIEHLRGERPSLFKTPTGSGATGSNSPGSAKTITRAEYEKLDPMKRLEAAQKFKITE